MSNSPTQAAVTASPAETSRQIRELLHAHLRHSTRVIKTMDLAVLGCIWIAVILCVWLLACVLDHWVYPLPMAVRWVVWLGGVCGTGYWLIGWVTPLIIHRINPAYAARRIEQAIPEFKDGLISWLELEQLPDNGVPKGIMAGLARHAARFLHGQDPASTVDSTPLIRLLSVVFFLTTGLVVYTMLSPKSVTATGKRVLMPWSDIAPPTRVQIISVKPGSCELTQGKPLDVSVELRGASRGDQVAVKFSTVDGQIRNQLRQMQVQSDGHNYAGSVLTGPRGVDHELDYWIEAGDAQAGPFRVTLNPLPSVVETSVVIEFPKYTKLPSRTVVTGAPAEAVEGSTVTVTAESNQPLARARIEIHPETDANGDLLRSSALIDMRIDNKVLVGTIPLRLNAARDNPTEIKYRLRGFNQRNDANQSPAIQSIRVIADLPPEISLAGPDSRYLKVLADSQVNLEIRASDPDFGLSHIALVVKRQGLVIQEKSLLDSDGTTGRQVQIARLVPTTLGASVGDRFEIVAIAHDNRHDPNTGSPSPNVTTSLPLLLEIVDAKQFANEPPTELVTQPDPDNKRSDSSPETTNSASTDPNEAATKSPAARPNQTDNSSNASRTKQASNPNSGKSAPSQSKDGNDAPPSNNKPQSDPTQAGKQPQSGKQGSSISSQQNKSQTDSRAGKSNAGKEAASTSSDGSKQENSQDQSGSSNNSSGKSAQERARSSQKSAASGNSSSSSNDSNSSESPSASGKSSGNSGKSSGSQRSSNGSDSGSSRENPTSPSTTGGNQESTAGKSSSTAGNNSKSVNSQASDQQAGQTTQGSGDSSTKASGSAPADRSPTEQKSANSEGQRQKPSNDGEAIRRVEQYMQQRQQQAEGSNSEQTTDSSKSTEKAATSKTRQSSDPSRASDQSNPDQSASSNTSNDPSQSQQSDSPSSTNNSSNPAGSNSASQSDASNENAGQKGNLGQTDRKSESNRDSANGAQQSPSSDSKDQSSASSQAPNSKGNGTQESNSASPPSANSGNQSKSNKSDGAQHNKSNNQQPSNSNSAADQASNQKSSGEKSAQGSHSSGQSPGPSSQSGKSGSSNSQSSKGQSSNSPSTSGDKSAAAQPATSGPKSGNSQDQAGSQGSKPSDNNKQSQEQGSSPNQSNSSDSGSSKSGSSNTSNDKSNSSNPGSQPQTKQPNNGQSGKPESKGSPSDSSQSSNDSSQSQSSSQSSNQSDGQSGGKSSSGQSSGNSKPGQSSSRGPSSGGQPGTGNSSPSGTAGSGSNSERSAQGAQPANENFSSQTTQMALDYLARQKDQPDPELLRKLDWTENDLNEFLKRWEGARNLAKSKDPADQQKWNETLRDLELQIRPANPTRALSHDDSLRQMQESRTRIPPPEAIRSQYESFMKALRESSGQ